jgi:MYXO-CTERM domain-containing protein
MWSGGGLGAGGAVCVIGGAVLIVNSTLANNQAQGGTGGEPGSGLGGAIFNLHGKVEILHSTIIGNKVASGQVLSTSYRNPRPHAYARGSGVFHLSIARPLEVGPAASLLTLTNSVIADNQGSFDLASDRDRGGEPLVVLKGQNYISSDSDFIVSPAESGHLLDKTGLGATINHSDGPLAVWVPDATSPVVGAGAAEGCADPRVLRQDELGSARPQDKCTLGAVEVRVASGTKEVACGYAGPRGAGSPLTLFSLFGLAGLGLLASRIRRRDSI